MSNQDNYLAAAAEEAETLTTFLAGVGKALKGTVGVDVELATILSDNLLTVTPHANAVANAKAAITMLASTRALTDAVAGAVDG